VKKAKKAPAKATAKAPVGPYEKAVEGGKKLVKTASNRYILEDVAALLLLLPPLLHATSSTSTKAELTDELTEPISGGAARQVVESIVDYNDDNDDGAE
jgi:hypothetical protein